MTNNPLPLHYNNLLKRLIHNGTNDDTVFPFGCQEERYTYIQGVAAGRKDIHSKRVFDKKKRLKGEENFFLYYCSIQVSAD